MTHRTEWARPYRASSFIMVALCCTSPPCSVCRRYSTREKISRRVVNGRATAGSVVAWTHCTHLSSAAFSQTDHFSPAPLCQQPANADYKTLCSSNAIFSATLCLRAAIRVRGITALEQEHRRLDGVLIFLSLDGVTDRRLKLCCAAVADSQEMRFARWRKYYCSMFMFIVHSRH